MKLILAADENWGIGKDGGLLCHIPSDLKFFKEKTLGKVVIMGRVTLESLPGKKGLPGRTNIVLTRNPDYKAENAIVVNSEEELFAKIKEYDADDVMLIGGAELYNRYLPLCDICYITKMYKSFDADRHFANLDEMPEFEKTALDEIKEENGVKYRFFMYERKK